MIPKRFNKKEKGIPKPKEFQLTQDQVSVVQFYASNERSFQIAAEAFSQKIKEYQDQLAKELSIDQEKNIILWNSMFMDGKIRVIPKPEIKVETENAKS